MIKYVLIWEPLIRVIHWLLVIAFTLNYFLLESGSDLHQIVGYVAFCAILTRIAWGFFSNGYGGLSHLKLGLESFNQHFAHLKEKKIPPKSGHNPIGWLMILCTWLLFIGLAVTGFMLEEVDYFFGSSLVEDIHSILSDVLYALVILHIIAVFFVAWWGKVSLIRPMITGKRKL